MIGFQVATLLWVEYGFHFWKPTFQFPLHFQVRNLLLLSGRAVQLQPQTIHVCMVYFIYFPT